MNDTSGIDDPDSNRRSRKEFIIGGTIECRHPEGEQVFLGHMVETPLYRCGVCDAVVVTLRSDSP